MENREKAKNFLLSAAQRIFGNWSALEMVVKHGMGTQDSAIDFCPWIVETLLMNENPCTKEVEEVLEDYMEYHFNTELEDGSPEQVAELLLKFYRHCKEGIGAVALAEMEELPVLKPWILGREEIRQISIRSVERRDNNVEKMEVQPEDEWTTVTSRKKK